MSNSISVLGADPAFRNMGLVLVDVNTDTLEMRPRVIKLIKTEKSKDKKVKVSSDNLSRAKILSKHIRHWESFAKIMVAEIPSGAQSAKAAYGFGVAVGVVSGHTIPLIPVTPLEAKASATGYKNASKSDMIEWATGKWPDLQWPMGNGRGQFAPYSGDAEHLADALAIVKAGIESDLFKELTKNKPT